MKGRRVVGLALPLALTCERERWDQTRPNLLLGEVVLVLVVEKEEENKRVEWRGRRRHTRILSGFRRWVAVVAAAFWVEEKEIERETHRPIDEEEEEESNLL